MNKTLLLKVKAAILAKPERFDMDNWCGTSHCIAGHAAVIAGWLKPNAAYEFLRRSWTPSANAKADDCDPDVVASDGSHSAEPFARLLRLDEDQAERLFYSEEWPTPFAEAYKNATGPGARAGIAADRIDHFIATDGRE